MMMKPPFPPNFPPSNPPGINNPQAIDFNDLAHYDTRIKQYVDEHDASIKENVYTKSEIDVMLQGWATTEELEGVKEKLTVLSIEASSQQALVEAVKEDNIRHETLIQDLENKTAALDVKIGKNETSFECLTEAVKTTKDEIEKISAKVEEDYKTYVDSEIQELKEDLLGLDVSEAYNTFREIQDHLISQDNEIQELEDKLSSVLSSNYVTEDDLAEFATREQLEDLRQDTEAELSRIAKDAEIQQESLEELSASLKDTDISLTEAKKDIEAVSSKLDSIDTEKASNERVDEISRRLSDVENSSCVSTEYLETKLQSYAKQSDLASVQSSVTHVEQKLSVAEQHIVGLNNSLIDTHKEIDSVKNSINSYGVTIASIDTEVSNIKERLTSQNNRIAQNHTDIDSLNQRVTTTETNVTNVLEKQASVEAKISAQDQAIYATHLEIDDVKERYATKEYVDTVAGLSSSLNNVLFNDGETVGVTLGGFTQGDSISGLTLKQILTKLLLIGSHTPDEPEVPVLSPVVQQIVDEKLPVHDLDNTGSLVSKEFVENYWTEEQAKQESNETCFYHIQDGSKKVIESGYQVAVAPQSTDWLTVAIPDIVTDFHVEQYDVMLGDWSVPNWNLEKTEKYSVPGCNVYTVPERYGVTSGITIRIVVKD